MIDMDMWIAAGWKNCKKCVLRVRVNEKMKNVFFFCSFEETVFLFLFLHKYRNGSMFSVENVNICTCPIEIVLQSVNYNAVLYFARNYLHSRVSRNRAYNRATRHRALQTQWLIISFKANKIACRQ